MLKNTQTSDEDLLWNEPQRVPTTQLQKYKALAVCFSFITFIFVLIDFTTPDTTTQQKFVNLGFYLGLVTLFTIVAVLQPPKEKK